MNQRTEQVPRTKNHQPGTHVIAIDGPAASGKSSVARSLAKQLGFLFVSSGHYYRALAWAAEHDQLDLSNAAAVDAWLCSLLLNQKIIQGTLHLFINHVDVTEHLSDPSVNALVSPLAALPAVRTFLLQTLRALAADHHLVMEGRDIGSVVFPKTPWKFYLDASPEERARRRAREGAVDVIADRDQRDSTRAAAPLMIAPGAIVIDTTHLSIDDVVQEILKHSP